MEIYRHDPVEIECAWDEEIRHREIDSGAAELIPAEEVFPELHPHPRR